VSDHSDARLLDQARAGDLWALEQLIERHQAQVYRFGLKMCREPEDAKDVLQDTLLAMARGIREFRGTASLSTWLYTVARSEPFLAKSALTPRKDAPMIFRQLFDSATSTYTYLVADEASRKAALIDPVRETLDRDLALIRELGLELRYVLETHVHADHVTSAGRLAELTGAVTVASPLGAECASTRLRHGEVIQLGALELKALATPGHTRDSLSFLVEDNVFTGDALLVRGTGRTDFQSGSAGELYDSITKILFSLPDSTRVWPGHDYRGHTASTIGEERRFNPRLCGKNRDEFVALMDQLKLAPPKNIHEAVPANLACGRTISAA
jgi:sulfur dioxygenase